ncbi:hypothetical protein Tco_1387622, partial [Tanacetum coccineum]
MFVESLGLTGLGVINSSDGRVVTRADRTTMPISIVFGRFKDMPVSSAEADFTADTAISLNSSTAVNIEVVEADPSSRIEFLPAYMDL